MPLWCGGDVIKKTRSHMHWRQAELDIGHARRTRCPRWPVARTRSTRPARRGWPPALKCVRCRVCVCVWNLKHTNNALGRACRLLPMTRVSERAAALLFPLSFLLWLLASAHGCQGVRCLKKLNRKCHRAFTFLTHAHMCVYVCACARVCVFCVCKHTHYCAFACGTYLLTF